MPTNRKKEKRERVKREGKRTPRDTRAHTNNPSLLCERGHACKSLFAARLWRVPLTFLSFHPHDARSRNISRHFAPLKFL